MSAEDRPTNSPEAKLAFIRFLDSLTPEEREKAEAKIRWDLHMPKPTPNPPRDE